MEFLKKIQNLTGEELKMTYDEFLATIDSPFFSLSASALAQFTTPFNFALYKMRKKDSETKAMLIGSLVHCMLLEKGQLYNRYIVSDCAVPRSKNQKDFCEQLAAGVEICEAYKVAYSREKSIIEVKNDDMRAAVEAYENKLSEIKEWFLSTQKEYENQIATYKTFYLDILERITLENITESKKEEKIKKEGDKYDLKVAAFLVKKETYMNKFDDKLKKADDTQKKAYLKITEWYGKELSKYDEMATTFSAWIDVLKTKSDRQVVPSATFAEAFEIATAIETNEAAMKLLVKCKNFESRLDFTHRFESGTKTWLFTGFVDGWGFDDQTQKITIMDLKKRISADPKKLKYDIQFGDIGVQLVIYALGLLKKHNDENVGTKRLGLANIDVNVLTCDNSQQTSIMKIKPETLIDIYSRLELKMIQFNRCIENEAWAQSYEFFSLEEGGEYLI